MTARTRTMERNDCAPTRYAPADFEDRCLLTAPAFWIGGFASVGAWTVLAALLLR